MKNKGFTLIELLAVIVIIAIIALITIPLIISVIENSKIGAFKSSIHRVIEAGELKITKLQLESKVEFPYTFDLSINDNLLYKGKKMIGGLIVFDNKNDIIVENITDGNFCGNGTLKNIEITKGNCQNEIANKYKVKEILNTFDTVYAIMENGDLYGWGYRIANEITLSPVKIKHEVKFENLYSGDYRFYGINKAGNLYGWGISYNSPIGPGEEYEDYPEPTLIKGDTKFKKVYATSDRNYAIDLNGELYAWGNPNIGDGTTEKRSVPVKILASKKIVNVISAQYNSRSYALSESGELYGWGDGPLGDGTSDAKLSPIQIMPGKKIIDFAIGSGQSGSYAIDSDGNLYGWGILVGDGTEEIKLSPVQIMDGTKFKKVFTSNFNFYAITELGDLYACGVLTGDGTEEYRLSPVQIMPGVKIKNVFIDPQSANYYILSESNELYGWGISIGDGTEEYRLSPIKIMEGTKIEKVFLNGMRVYAITESKELYGWGFYVIGNGTEENVLLPTKIKF